MKKYLFLIIFKFVIASIVTIVEGYVYKKIKKSFFINYIHNLKIYLDMILKKYTLVLH